MPRRHLDDASSSWRCFINCHIVEGASSFKSRRNSPSNQSDIYRDHGSDPSQRPAEYPQFLNGPLDAHRRIGGEALLRQRWLPRIRIRRPRESKELLIWTQVLHHRHRDLSRHECEFLLICSIRLFSGHQRRPSCLS